MQRLLNDYPADLVRDLVIEMTNAQHVDVTLANDNVMYTREDDGVYGWQWLNDEQLAELHRRLEDCKDTLWRCSYDGKAVIVEACSAEDAASQAHDALHGGGNGGWIDLDAIEAVQFSRDLNPAERYEMARHGYCFENEGDQ